MKIMEQGPPEWRILFLLLWGLLHALGRSQSFARHHVGDFAGWLHASGRAVDWLQASY